MPAHDTLRAEYGPIGIDFIRALNAHAVEYMLVSEYAVGMYGDMRTTTAIDFFSRSTLADVDRLMRAMALFGAPA